MNSREVKRLREDETILDRLHRKFRTPAPWNPSETPTVNADLLRACKGGKVDVVRRILYNRAVNNVQPNFDDDVCLLEAVRGGHETVVGLLLKETFPNASRPTARNGAIFIEALAEVEQSDIPRIFLSWTDPDTKLGMDISAHSNMAIKVAILTDSVNAIRLLLFDAQVYVKFHMMHAWFTEMEDCDEAIDFTVLPEFHRERMMDLSFSRKRLYERFLSTHLLKHVHRLAVSLRAGRKSHLREYESRVAENTADEFDSIIIADKIAEILQKKFANVTAANKSAVGLFTSIYMRAILHLEKDGEAVALDYLRQTFTELAKSQVESL